MPLSNNCGAPVPDGHNNWTEVFHVADTVSLTFYLADGNNQGVATSGVLTVLGKPYPVSASDFIVNTTHATFLGKDYTVITAYCTVNNIEINLPTEFSCDIYGNTIGTIPVTFTTSDGQSVQKTVDLSSIPELRVSVASDLLRGGCVADDGDVRFLAEANAAALLEPTWLKPQYCIDQVKQPIVKSQVTVLEDVSASARSAYDRQLQIDDLAAWYDCPVSFAAPDCAYEAIATYTIKHAKCEVSLFVDDSNDQYLGGIAISHNPDAVNISESIAKYLLEGTNAPKSDAIEEITKEWKGYNVTTVPVLGTIAYIEENPSGGYACDALTYYDGYYIDVQAINETILNTIVESMHLRQQ